MISSKPSAEIMLHVYNVFVGFCITIADESQRNFTFAEQLAPKASI
jgi:hypothetical protein